MNTKGKLNYISVCLAFLLLFVFLQFALPSSSFAQRGGGKKPDIEEPTSEVISDKGVLYGDLYVILRYQGGDTKRVPKFYDSGKPVFVDVSWTDPACNEFTVVQQDWEEVEAVGGEPVLTENFVPYTIIDEDTGEFVPNPLSGDIWYLAPFPSQCVQPIASYERWGDISGKSTMDQNRLPLSMVYDSTWDRTECEVGLQTISGDGTVVTDPWFVEPGTTWTDPVNGLVTYTAGVQWLDLVQEASFGRMSISRAPEAVLNASFDEAIQSINSAVAIETDASGRLLLTREVYSEFEVDPDSGEPVLLGTAKKAIDSPLENLSLYVKLMRDGHLVTPGDERGPIDRSDMGGIPLGQWLELTDGPADTLRPTIDIDKVRQWGLDHLVDVAEQEYYIYFQVTYTNPSTCIPVSRELVATLGSCDALGDTDECGEPVICEGPFIGIMSDDGGKASGDDFKQAAAHFAAAADKTGDISVDMVVYLNSIFGLNKVTGYSAYNADGTPLPDAVNYAVNPIYYNFSGVTGYSRGNTFQNRGEVSTPGGNNSPSSYTGTVLVLQPSNSGWVEHETTITGDPQAVNNVNWNDLIVGWNQETQQPTHSIGTEDIHGFTQMADDDLSVIEFIHTYQIPERR